MTRIPDIIAHRGTPRECLENTLPSFERALAQGADGIELDVHCTSDGVVVVHHDPVVRTRPMDPASLIAIADTSWAALSSVELKDGSRIPTLDSVLSLVPTGVTVYVEVKATAMEAALVACLNGHQGVSVAVHGFDHRIPVAVRALAPALRIGVLSTSYPLSLRDFIGATKADAFWQQAQLIDHQLVSDAHALGAKVIAWTENDPTHARQLIAMGVDALCTDTPGLLRAALSR